MCNHASYRVLYEGTSALNSRQLRSLSLLEASRVARGPSEQQGRDRRRGKPRDLQILNKMTRQKLATLTNVKMRIFRGKLDRQMVDFAISLDAGIYVIQIVWVRGRV